MSEQPAAQRCYRHPDREAYIRCQRCERLVCPDCMRDASVGFQCPECVREGAKTVRQPRTVTGGRVSANPGAVTLTLIGINVAVFVLTDLVRLGVIDAVGVMRADAVPYGTTVYPGVMDGGYWRMLTAAFLHSGPTHLLFNMLALYLFGTFVEQALGTWRYVAAYLTTAIGSSVFVYWLASPVTSTVGASGAVFGLLGMALMLLLKAREDVRGLLVLLAINGVLSLQGNISWQGHLGGFVVGCILGAVLAWTPRERRTLVHGLTWVLLWIAIVGFTLLRTIDLTSV
ncbi:MAG: rhomboid family intramembrane serine protease [Aeromicrobium erythreum]